MKPVSKLTVGRSQTTFFYPRAPIEVAASWVDRAMPMLTVVESSLSLSPLIHLKATDPPLIDSRSRRKNLPVMPSTTKFDPVIRLFGRLATAGILPSGLLLVLRPSINRLILHTKKRAGTVAKTIHPGVIWRPSMVLLPSQVQQMLTMSSLESRNLRVAQGLIFQSH